MKARYESLLVLILLLPLVWVHSPDSHDWGGDFSAYIAQAGNILSGDPIGETGYIYNPDYYRLAPPSYPPGFSILLAPVLLFFGSDIAVLVAFMGILAVAFGWSMFCVLRPRFSRVEAIGLTLLTVYNPWFLWFKVEVIADLPFALFTMLSILAYRLALRKNHALYWLLTAAVVAFTVLIKTIGLVVFIAILIDGTIRLFRHRNLRESLVAVMVFIPLTPLFYFLVNRLWLPAPAGHFQHFTGIAEDRGGFFSSILTHLDTYFKIYQSFFVRDLGEWAFAGTFTAAAVLFFALFGLIRQWLERPYLEDWVFLGLMAALLMFPITNGFRYLLPAFPFLFGYTALGLCCLRIPYRLIPYAPVLLMLLLAAQYSKGWVKISKAPNMVEGPYHPKYQKLHDELAELPEDAVLFAAKPRVFAYLDKVKAASVRPDADHLGFVRQVVSLSAGKPAYLLSVRATPHERIDAEAHATGREDWVLVRLK